MRVGVKYQPARDALQRCVLDHAAVNHYYNALSLVRQSLLAGLSIDPYGNGLWAPRISTRISKSSTLLQVPPQFLAVTMS
jgi:hypothetical protein